MAVSVAKEGIDLTPVRKEITSLMHNRSHDDGSYAPLLIRFAWHNSGTYDAATKTGGSNGATMRFPEERNDPENRGLGKAIKLLEPVCAKFPFLSKADVWILAGYVAIEASGGPQIPFSYGRVDYTLEQARAVHGNASGCPFGDGKFNPHKSRLPAADLGQNPNAPRGCPMHIKEKPTIDSVRSTFARMGLSDKETVCLIILGHQYGRCHMNVSGYEHPWYAFGPTEWNAYKHGLGYPTLYSMIPRGMHAEVKNVPSGKRQFNFNLGFRTREPFMMLPSDMALWWDPDFRNHVIAYNSDRSVFRADAARAWKKLTELGCGSSLVTEKGGEFERYWRG